MRVQGTTLAPMTQRARARRPTVTTMIMALSLAPTPNSFSRSPAALCSALVSPSKSSSWQHRAGFQLRSISSPTSSAASSPCAKRSTISDYASSRSTHSCSLQPLALRRWERSRKERCCCSCSALAMRWSIMRWVGQSGPSKRWLNSRPARQPSGARTAPRKKSRLMS